MFHKENDLLYGYTKKQIQNISIQYDTIFIKHICFLNGHIIKN